MEQIMKKTLIAVGISTAVLLSGCVSTEITSPSTYSKVNMQAADIMPSKEEIKGAKLKVVIFNPDDTGIKLAKNAKLGHSIANTIEQYASKSGVEIVDRNLANKLKQEIELAEMKGKHEYQGPNIADYAITGTVSAVNVGATFSEASSWIDKKGKKHITPASCRYSASVTANLRIYKLPALNFSKAITIDDNVGTSSETRNSSCSFSQASAESLARQAAVAAVKDARTDFQNHFSAKAYVLEQRKKDGENIFKLSRGNDMGFVSQAEVHFYHLEASKNPLSGEMGTEEYRIATGTVSNQVGTNFAWVVIDDEKQAEKIKLGDYVKVEFSKSWHEF